MTYVSPMKNVYERLMIDETRGDGSKGHGYRYAPCVINKLPTYSSMYLSVVRRYVNYEWITDMYD